MISRLLFYKSNSFNPYENLGAEKYLSSFVDENTVVLYLWQNENTVVIGTNQNPWSECKCALLTEQGGFVARRNSGGGAVFHDKGNLNFTFITTKSNYNQAQNFEIIKSACELAGIFVEISGRNDVLANGKKFSGNAFYFSGNIAYHHGTLMVSSNQQKLEQYLTPNQEKLRSKGVKSVKSRVINLSDICPALTTEKLAEYMLKATEQHYNLSASAIENIPRNELENDIETFSSWEYIYGKTLPFSVTVSGRLNIGNIEINLNFSEGKISEAKVFTDAMDYTLSNKIENTLIGCEPQISSIKKRLKSSLSDEILTDILSLLKNVLS